MEVEVYVVKAQVDDGFPDDDIQTWRVHEQSDNKILISDASKPTYYLGADSNGESISRDVVSTIRDDTDSVEFNFTFGEF